MITFSRSFLLLGITFLWIITLDILDIIFLLPSMFQSAYRPLIARAGIAFSLCYMIIECLRQKKNTP